MTIEKIKIVAGINACGGKIAEIGIKLINSPKAKID